MRIRVSLVPSEELNAGTAEVGFVNVECGKGTQIVRWLAHEAVRRMEELAGIPTSTPSLVPQAVSDATGIILDPDTVLKEVAKDGDSVLVRFGRGIGGRALLFRGELPHSPAQCPAKGIFFLIRGRFARDHKV